MKTKLVTKDTDVPQRQHYGIIVFKSKQIHHEGDERSRTNPGHGYPAYTERIQLNDYYVTLDKKLWEADVIELHNKQEKFSAFIVEAVAAVQQTVTTAVHALTGEVRDRHL